MRNLLLVGAALVVGACENPGPSVPSSSTVAAPAARDAYDFYGAGTGLDATVAVADVLENPAPHLQKTVRVRGPIVGTCANKGCWMRLGSADDNVFVKFKDYGFFVPTGGVEGRDAVIEGVLAVETQSVDEIKHYLEDAGKHAEAAKVTEPTRVLSFVATGVAIKKS